MRIPHCVEPHWPAEIGKSRAVSLIQTESADGCIVALLGMPDDTGVGLNGGRLGAARGPSAIRAALANYGSATPIGLHWPGIFDAGDVEPAGDDLHATHERVSNAAAAIVHAGMLPIGLGGGHDLTYAFVRGVSSVRPITGGVYFDAHLDVREESGSGMGFRRLVEDCGIKSLFVHGLDRLANSAEHTSWFASHGGRADPFEFDDPWPDGDLFVSLDLDVIDQAYAPGVSAMNPNGWTPERTERWVRAAGREAGVRCFDIMELCPPHDESGRTARLAARLLLAFLAGFAERR